MTATKPVICEEAKTVNQDGGSDMADIVSVSPDSSKTVNAIDVVSETDWMPIRTDAHGRPFNIFVRPVKQCSRWKFTRVYLEIKGADEFRIRIGDVYVIDWVSTTVSRHILYSVLRLTSISMISSRTCFQPVMSTFSTLFLPPMVIAVPRRIVVLALSLHVRFYVNS